MISYTMAKVCKLFLAVFIVYGFYIGTDALLYVTKTLVVSSFKFSMCDLTNNEDGYKFRFPEFVMLTTEEGDLDFTGSFATKYNLSSPLKATVVLKKNILGFYVTIPCMNNFGSCTFEDLCEFGFPEGECPPILEQMNFPCRCPVEAGEYNIPVIKFKKKAETEWAYLFCGSYIGNIKLYEGDTLLTCYNLEFILE